MFWNAKSTKKNNKIVDTVSGKIKMTSHITTIAKIAKKFNLHKNVKLQNARVQNAN